MQIHRTRTCKILGANESSTAVTFRKLALGSCFAAISCLPSVAHAQAYKVTNIISDGSVPAAITDAGFINPWAMSSSGNWWISTQGSGSNYVIPATTGAIAFKVVVPSASTAVGATGLPAGSVTTAGATGMILPNATKASFLFSTLDGTISGWNSKLGTAGAISQIVINNSAAGAIYPGLAILNIATAGVTSKSYVLAPNFGPSNAIEVYDETFKTAKLTGTFTDPTLPTNYAPFSVHVIGTQIFVAYALRSTTTPYRTVSAPGNGIVSIFDINGNFVSRAVTGGNLNSPWGIAIAPANFGIFSNDLLIGNFGDGLINVYDPKTFAYIGQLMDGTGKSLVYASLWELLPGGTAITGATTVSGGDTSTVYFTAGLANEAHGLLAGIANTVTAGSTPTFGFSASAPTATVIAGSSVQTTFSVAPVNGFSGTVNLACAGLPIGASCIFSPAQVTTSPTTATPVSVTIQTSKASAALRPSSVKRSTAAGLVSALLLPFISLAALRRRTLPRSSYPFRLLLILFSSVAVSGILIGCSSGSYGATPTPTPAGQSTVTVSATSGAITQQTSFALIVK